MREILTDLEAAEFLSDPNPMKRAQTQMRAALPKRFYKEVTTALHDGSHAVLLDGKPVKTPARKLLAFATDAAARLVAGEFEAQDKVIDPASMPFTRLANSAIDGVANETGAVLDDIVRFAGTDLLCYRAGGPDALTLRQTDCWDRYLDWIKARHGARFHLAEGVMHIEQPKAAIDAFAKALKPHADAIPLACLHAMTTLTGSAILALAVAEGEASAEEAWKAAHLDEDWTIEQWGADHEAAERRAYKWTEMNAASQMLQAVRQSARA